MEAPIEATRSGIAVTIAYGTAYPGTHAVFTGSPEQVRRDLIAFFGMRRESVGSVALADLVANASQQVCATATVGATLGGRVTASEPAQPVEPARPVSVVSAATEPGDTDPWTAARQPEATEPQRHPLLDSIERAADVASLRRLWAENQDAFADPEVMAAWKVRGRALQQAA